jgi:hypothetical protein
MLLVALSLLPAVRIVNVVKNNIDKTENIDMLVARWPDLVGRIRKPAVGAGRRTA